MPLIEENKPEQDHVETKKEEIDPSLLFATNGGADGFSAIDGFDDMWKDGMGDLWQWDAFSDANTMPDLPFNLKSP